MQRIITVSLFAILLIPAQSTYSHTSESVTCAQQEEATPTYLKPSVRPMSDTSAPTPIPAPAPTLAVEQDSCSFEFLEELYCPSVVKLNSEMYLSAGVELESDIINTIMQDFGASKVLAFTLPSGTPLYSPMKGRGQEFGFMFFSSEEVYGPLYAVSVEREKGKRKGRYVFFFAGALFKAHIPKTAPVKEGQVLGTLTDETIGFPLNPTDEEFNLIVFIS